MATPNDEERVDQAIDLIADPRDFLPWRFLPDGFGLALLTTTGHFYEYPLENITSESSALEAIFQIAEKKRELFSDQAVGAFVRALRYLSSPVIQAQASDQSDPIQRVRDLMEASLEKYPKAKWTPPVE